jgi:hydrogenase/urease accessory protein HupE
MKKITIATSLHGAHRKMVCKSIWYVCLCLFSLSAWADVVRPAQIEITAQADGTITLEIRASLEALLTGINAAYQNTQDAPQSAEYDALRQLSADQLRQQFRTFQPQFMRAIRLTTDQQDIRLRLDSLNIPPPGYTQVPRISLLKLSGQLPAASQALQWYYPARFGDNAVRLRQADPAANQWYWSDWQWLRSDRPSTPFSLQVISPQTSAWSQLVDYSLIGYRHIIPLGADHILFILGLYLYGTRWRPLIWQVSLFTLAHSLTLGLGIFGWVQLPSRWVEPLIAASIVFVALENLRPSTNAPPPRRLLIVFGFGLLHGLGFADMLRTFNMPTDTYLTTLLGFNLGVELGQLSILAAAFALTGWLRQQPNQYQHWVAIPGSILIGLTGLVWTLQRLTLLN